MIFDKMENAALYYGAHPLLKDGFALANRLIAEKAPVGKHEGENGVYAMVQEYDSYVKTPDEVRFEAHREYIDLQILVSGKETVVVAYEPDCKVDTPYTPDYALYTPDVFPVQNITLTDNTFAVFFPLDAHAPGLAFEGKSEKIAKIVVKIPV